ncbi:hypothetical protein Tdes44962_MAKER03037 [Teratosphaeria destructans]|uniref:Uncharacterized protein n=1 Tax=Teratosphaeria destructans TaxID=418781 RepID=A0A9W7W226_9PEZI|nr:hypothetical protein Tdes44962_MAKER03037 [Teratosphaeria destructans]
MTLKDTQVTSELLEGELFGQQLRNFALSIDGEWVKWRRLAVTVTVVGMDDVWSEGIEDWAVQEYRQWKGMREDSAITFLRK